MSCGLKNPPARPSASSLAKGCWEVFALKCNRQVDHGPDIVVGMAKIFDSDLGIRRSNYSGLVASEVDEIIVTLHNAGWPQSKIARHLKGRGAIPATQQGVGKALKRIRANRVGAGPRG